MSDITPLKISADGQHSAYLWSTQSLVHTESAMSLEHLPSITLRMSDTCCLCVIYSLSKKTCRLFEHAVKLEGMHLPMMKILVRKDETSPGMIQEQECERKKRALRQKAVHLLMWRLIVWNVQGILRVQVCGH